MLEAAGFYEERVRGLGQEFLNEIEQALPGIREHPEISPKVLGDIRKRLLNRFPYALLFSEEPDAILIVAIAHLSRRPGYWIDRI